MFLFLFCDCNLLSDIVLSIFGWNIKRKFCHVLDIFLKGKTNSLQPVGFGIFASSFFDFFKPIKSLFMYEGYRNVAVEVHMIVETSSLICENEGVSILNLLDIREKVLSLN